MKKVISSIVCLLVLCTAFVGCGKEKAKVTVNEKVKKDVSSSAPSSSISTETPSTIDIDEPDIMLVDFDNAYTTDVVATVPEEIQVIAAPSEDIEESANEITVDEPIILPVVEPEKVVYEDVAINYTIDPEKNVITHQNPGWSSKIIASTEDLNEIKNVDCLGYKKLKGVYTDEFFKNKSLVVVSKYRPGSAYHPEVTGLIRNGNMLTVNFVTSASGCGTCVVSYSLCFIEVDKADIVCVDNLVISE